MTMTYVWALQATLAVAALLSWGAVVADRYGIERAARPVVIVTMAALAFLHAGGGFTEIGQAPPWESIWRTAAAEPSLGPILLALALSLGIDALLLTATSRRYVLALLGALPAVSVWAWAVQRGPTSGLPWLVLPVGLLLYFMHRSWGADVVRFAGRQRGLVLLVRVLFGALGLVAAWHGDLVVVTGALLLGIADLVLGHDRFVLERRWAPVQTVMAGQVGLGLLVFGLVVGGGA